MNNTKMLGTSLLAVAVLAVVSTPGFAIEFYLRADVTTLDMPGEPNIPMWGFALENSTFTAGTPATVPGPLLVIPPGETTLTVHLKNNLTAANIGLSMGCPVSLVIPGQALTTTGPVRFGPMPYPQYEGRLRSLSHETPPDSNTVVDYVWTDLKPGTYVYHSGTHIQCHVQMGLYGGVIKDHAAAPYKQAYPNVVYDVNVPLFFSEIDPAFHYAVDSNNYGPGKAMTSTIDYEPKYFLINGATFYPNQPIIPIAAGSSGGGTLLRLFNMGLETRSIVLQGSYMSLVAEDGQPYEYPREHYAALLPAGKTLDAMVAFPQAGTYPIYDRRLGLLNNQASPGGMLRFLELTAGNVWPVINSVTATPEPIWDVQTSQLLADAVDGDAGPAALSYSWEVPAGLAPSNLDSTTIPNPVFTPPFVPGTQTYTFTVTVSDGANVDIGTVDVTVMGYTAPVINSVTATPSTIFDTQTSQLSVDATDGDSAPDPLTYNWIVPPGAGSVDDATSATPVYTPPDVAATQVFTLSVEVSDGVDTIVDTVDVTVHDAAGGVVYEAEDATLSGAVVSSAIGGYTGTGFVDYVNASADFIEWTVNAPAGGLYQLQFRYALGIGDRPLEISVNGSITAANLSFPATGGWSTWGTVTTTATLNAGANTVRATAIGYSGGNVDHLEVTLVTAGGGIYEAENAVLSGAVVASTIAGYTGTGFADYVNATTDYIEWTVNASVAGSYELKFRYALGAGDRPLEIRVNGNVTAAGLSFPSTGGWATWGTVTTTATLNAGANTVRATAIGSSGGNLDHLEVTLLTAGASVYEAEIAVLSGAAVSSALGGYTGTGFVDYVNGSADYIEWTVNASPAGSYELQFRYALGSGDRPLEIRVNGVVVEPSMSFPATGSWTTWDTVSTMQTLNAGANTVRATAIGFSGANVDHLNAIGP